MRKKTEITEQEQDLFRDLMRNVKRHVHTKINVNTPTVRPKSPSPKKQEYVEDAFSDYETLPDVSSDDILEYARSGISNKILRNLRNGKYNVEAILDLHGKTADEARESLSYFLLKCQQKGTRHALIIHGKGRNLTKPVLKNKLNHWLRQTEQVLAFCSATLRDGRSGALYVLFKTGEKKS